MLVRDILCVNLGGDGQAICTQLENRGWSPTQVVDLAAASRILAQKQFQVGLLVMGAAQTVTEAALEACVKASKGTEWVAGCTTQALESSGFRDVILGFFLMYQTLPLDWSVLPCFLEHALQRAILRHRHYAPMHSAGALGMVGHGAAITHLRQQIRKVAATVAPVLIGGESGCGKELAAQAIHRCSRRASGPFVAVNCGAIAPSLIQSELFGYERGAFTGASAQHSGLIEAANGGTIFLDEIGDLPLELQTNLLRFLQEKTINRVGSVRSLTVDVRVVAASHIDLAEAVATGRFREDLYYRLNVLPIEVPPLRSRMEDVPELAEHFLHCCRAECSTRVDGFRRQAIAAMQAHHWPGNVRELHNRVRRAVVMAEQHLIGSADLGLAAPEKPESIGLDAARTVAERDVISLTLARAGSNITTAARELGISRMTLYRLMDKHSIAQYGQ
ncbi:sigma-54 interaction domain-containing protein [Rhodoferax sp. WC2427]|uniref:sigma-54 interaction domain-containing protein n=1 Tax=Rhodoferax sp. WC2427 TaxID=3234144 RepID=UPI0034672AC2